MPLLRGSFWRWVFVAVVVVVIGAATFYGTVVYLLGRVDTVVIPDLQGKEIMVALEELSQRNIDVRIDSVEFSNTFDKGRVIVQRPAANRPIKRGRAVHLVVSRGLNRIQLPDLTGFNIEVAQQLLRNNAMSVDRILQACSSLKRDVVIAQYPAPHFELPRSESVTLVMSTGPCYQYYILPNYRGVRFAKAVADLSRWQITYIHMDLPKSDQHRDTAADIVVDQEPPPGGIIRRGDLVRFYVPGSRQDSLAADAQLKYVSFQVPYGLQDREVRVRYYQTDLAAAEIDRSYTPGRKVEWIVFGAEGTPVEFYVDGTRFRRFELLREGE